MLQPNDISGMARGYIRLDRWCWPSIKIVKQATAYESLSHSSKVTLLAMFLSVLTWISVLKWILNPKTWGSVLYFSKGNATDT